MANHILPIRLSDKIIEYGIIFLIIFTPLAFGSVHFWAYTVLEFTVLFLIIIWLIKLKLTEKLTIPNLKSSIFNSITLPILLFISFTIFQLLPLPPKVLSFLSPATHYFYKKTIPAYDTPRVGSLTLELGTLNFDLGHPDDWRTISYHPPATKMELYKILTYIGAFFLVIGNITTMDKLKKITIVILITAFIISFIGILQKLTGTPKIYWIRDASYADSFGPYINRNHFANHIIMSIPLALGLIAYKYKKPSINSPKTWRSRLLNLESFFSNNGLLILFLMVAISSLVLAASRGGIMSFLFSIPIFLIMLSLSKSMIQKKGMLSYILLFAIIIAVWWFGINPVMKRFSEFEDKRFSVYMSTIKMIQYFPIFGVGLDCFKYIFPSFKGREITKIYLQTHNDYLQLLSETGVIGFGLAFLFFSLFFYNVIKQHRERHNPYVGSFAAGGIAGITAMLIHSTVEFNMHIPANALLFFMIMGITYNTAYTTTSHTGSDL